MKTLNFAVLKTWLGADGLPIRAGDRVIRVSGKPGLVVGVDAGGYARLEGEVSTFYVPNLRRAPSP